MRSPGGFPDPRSYNDERNSQLQYREEMVRFHGSILRETGKIFTRQADILEQTCQASVGWQTSDALAADIMEMEARENGSVGNHVKLEMSAKEEAIDVKEKKGGMLKKPL